MGEQQTPARTSTQRMRREQRILLGIAVAVVPIGAAATLFIIGQVLGGGFVESLDVQNDSGERLELRAMGLGESGRLGGVLLVATPWFPLLPGPRVIVLEPGASGRIFYDWDDFNFCWLVVRGPGTTEDKLLPTGHPARKCTAGPDYRCCSPLQAARLVVPRLGPLELAPPEFSR